MKLAARREFLFLTSIVYGLAACATEAIGEQDTAAVSGGAGVGPLTGTTAAAGTGASEAATGSAGNAVAPATGNAATVTGGITAAGAAGDAAAATGGNTASAGTAGTPGTPAMSAAGAPAAVGGATFTAVFALLSGGCATGGYCHASTGGLSKLSLNDRTKSYMELVGVTAMGMGMPGSMAGGCMTSQIVRVKPGDPDNSLLMQKLDGKQTCGTVMPPGGMLLPDELELVRDWIMAGAKDD